MGVRVQQAVRFRRISGLGFRNTGVTVCLERESFINNLLVQVHFIIVTMRWTSLAPWESEFPFPGSLTSTFPYGRFTTVRIRLLRSVFVGTGVTRS